MHYVVTFSTTSDALACDSCIKAQSIEAKLIPIPAFLKAGCGFACLFQNSEEADLRAWLQNTAVAYETLIQVEVDIESDIKLAPTERTAKD